MKKSSIIGVIFALLIGALLGGWLVYKFKPLPQGMVIVSQSTVDSLDAYIAIADSLELIANLPPDTIYVDTIIYKKEIVYVETTPTAEPDPVDSSFQVYSDTLNVDGEINAWVKFKLKGYMIDNLHWGYEPIIKEITTIVEKKIPYPVIQHIEVPIPSTGNYLSLGVGGNGNLFIFGVDYDHVKRDYIYGLQYRRYGDVNVYGVKAGINLNTIFKK
jgi:hypothetical protein